MAVLTAAALTMASLSGCQSADKEETAADQTETETETAAGSITVTDQSGRTVTLDAPAERIVSSYYISTALLIALGCENKLTGIEMKGDTRPLYRMAAPQLLELPAVGSGKGINI